MSWILLCLLSAVLLLLLGELQLRRLRAPAEAHWTERARHLWPLRTSLGTGSYLMPCALALGLALGHSTATEAGRWLLEGYSAGLVGTLLALRWIRYRMRPLHTWPRVDVPFEEERLRLSLAPLELAVLCPFLAIGEPIAIRIALHALSLGLFAWHQLRAFGAHRLLGLIRPAPDWLREALAAEGSLSPPPRILELRTSLLNAFAVRPGKRILVTSGLLKYLDRSAVLAIVHHELNHLLESAVIQWVRTLPALLVLFFWNAMVWYDHLPWGIPGLVLVASGLLLVAAGRLRSSISRKLERSADRGAAIAAEEARIYGEALLRIHELNLIPATFGQKLTHPDLYDRLQHVGVEPPFARPAAPFKSLWPLAFVPLLALPFLGRAIAGLSLKHMELRTLPPVRIVLVGDSTVQSDSEDAASAGWGQMLGEFFTAKVEIANRARAGATTRSFLADGLWEQALAEKGDYLLIQFGLGDHLEQTEHGTEPPAEYGENLRRMVEEALAAGARPVLVTPAPSRTFDERGMIASILELYADAMWNVAEEEGVPVIELHDMCAALFESEGEVSSANCSASPDDPLHFSPDGAFALAWLIAHGLFTHVPELQPYLRTLRVGPRGAR